jgi:hypothetical protein
MKKLILIIFVLFFVGILIADVRVQTSFNSGELSPLIEGRSDISRYHSGCLTLENMVASPYGGASKRPGPYYICDANETTDVRLISFEHSIEQSYIIEMGNGYLRFYKEN